MQPVITNKSHFVDSRGFLQQKIEDQGKFSCYLCLLDATFRLKSNQSLIVLLYFVIEWRMLETAYVQWKKCNSLAYCRGTDPDTTIKQPFAMATSQFEQTVGADIY